VPDHIKDIKIPICDCMTPFLIFRKKIRSVTRYESYERDFIHFQNEPDIEILRYRDLTMHEALTRIISTHERGFVIYNKKPHVTVEELEGRAFELDMFVPLKKELDPREWLGEKLH